MSDRYRIDSHKLIFHPERVAKWQAGHDNWETAKDIYPIYLEVSPIGTCNHRCSFCGLDFMGYQNIKIPPEILKQRLSEMAKLGIKSIMFAGEGEPALYKELPDILDHCTEVGIDTSLTTNMVMFNDKNIDSIIRNTKWIKVSINAGTPETYAKIHGTKPQDFDIAINNMKKSVVLRKEKGYSCTIGAQMLLLDDNFDTAIPLAQATKEAGIDYLVIKPYSQHLLSNTTKYKNIDYSKYLYLKGELEKFNSSGFKVIFRTKTMDKLIDPDDKYKKCGSTPFFWGYIASNGDAYGCSCFLGNEKFKYGNINEDSFKEIWEGEGRKQGYDYVKNNLDVEKCRTNCRMDEINRYLWELNHPNPHVNFI
jgi:GTP 3',8-cyclase